ncbi:MAG: S8 family serine peptidase [Clostridiales bacterium]|nr:S8 family serine peptidase [Clostridiales bacterium]
MDKFDKRFVDIISERSKFDGGLVNILSKEENTTALVRVRNPLHLGLLERNFHVTAEYPFIRSVGIECSLRDAIRLERMQEVEYVSAQGKVFALGDEHEDKSLSADSNGDESRSAISSASGDMANANISARRGRYLDDSLTLEYSHDLDGKGVTMCVMDTGVSLHSDLSIPKERIVHFADMIGGEAQPYDDNGHGTFVAGVACGNGTLSGGRIIGVAPKASVVGIKVIGESGESGTFKILDGMQWLFDNFRQYGIRVVCMSFGAEPQSYADPLKLGAEMLARSGLIVVAASGNSGENSLKSPAISSEVIAVGAVDGDDKVARFTSRGVYQGVERPDVFADGVDVKGLRAGGTYSTMSGTSASAPYVAGACCLLCQKYRNLTPRQAKNAILNSASNVDGNRIFRL